MLNNEAHRCMCIELHGYSMAAGLWLREAYGSIHLYLYDFIQLPWLIINFLVKLTA